MSTNHDPIGRRDFLKGAASIALASAALPSVVAGQSTTRSAKKMIGIQIGAVSFVDEGVEQVLDIVQEKGNVDTIFLATFTYGRGIAGRQVPGQPLPDHGVQAYDEQQFHGGNYATPHPQFYEKTVLKQTRAPDHGDVDILELVLPAARKRGIRVYCWYEDQWRDDVPNIDAVREVNFRGERAATMCPMNPEYREFLIGLSRDYCTSYAIDGVMWASERAGPFNNVISRPDDPASRATCFCEHHQRAARERGIDVARARDGYGKLVDLVTVASKDQRPTDGYFVTFWRLLVEYPEILAWEKLWTDGKHAIYADIHRAAKAARPDVQVGLHIWHANSFSPFVRAEQDYASFARVADFLKIVVYNNCGGPRYVRYLDNVGRTIWRDVPRDDLLALHNQLLNYGDDEKGLAELPKSGLSSDYVARETRRAVEDVKGACRIYPGIDIDIPTEPHEKKTTPQDVFEATTAALKAGGDGVIFSRKYSEMRLANLAAGGRAVREFGG